MDGIPQHILDLMPKKPCGSFLSYANDILRDHPELFKNMKRPEKLKECGKLWSQLNPEEKQIYIDKARQLYDQFSIDYEEWQVKYHVAYLKRQFKNNQKIQQQNAQNRQQIGEPQQGRIVTEEEGYQTQQRGNQQQISEEDQGERDENSEESDFSEDNQSEELSENSEFEQEIQIRQEDYLLKRDEEVQIKIIDKKYLGINIPLNKIFGAIRESSIDEEILQFKFQNLMIEDQTKKKVKIQDDEKLYIYH